MTRNECTLLHAANAKSTDDLGKLVMVALDKNQKATDEVRDALLGPLTPDGGRNGGGLCGTLRVTRWWSKVTWYGLLITVGGLLGHDATAAGGMLRSIIGIFLP